MSLLRFPVYITYVNKHIHHRMMYKVKVEGTGTRNAKINWILYPSLVIALRKNHRQGKI